MISIMGFQRIIFFLMFISASCLGGEPLPRVKRQSPFAMGMQLFDNIRNSMDRAITGLLGIRSPRPANPGILQQQPSRLEVLRPPQFQDFPPPPPAQHHFEEGSNFAVHHGSAENLHHNFDTSFENYDSPVDSIPDEVFTQQNNGFSPSNYFPSLNNPHQGEISHNSNENHQDSFIPTETLNVIEDVRANTHQGKFNVKPDNPNVQKNVNIFSFSSPVSQGLNLKTKEIPTKPTKSTLKPLNFQISKLPVVQKLIKNNFANQQQPNEKLTSTAVITNKHHIVSGDFPKPFTHKKTRTTPSITLQQREKTHEKKIKVSVTTPSSVKVRTAAHITKTSKFIRKPRPSLVDRTPTAAPSNEILQKSSSKHTARNIIPPRVSRHIPNVVNTGVKLKMEDGTGLSDKKYKGYEFGYGVQDDSSGNRFFHAEQKSGGLTRGSYRIQLPDGRIQTVSYVADENGFRPKITYEGDAIYPLDEIDNKESS